MKKIDQYLPKWVPFIVLCIIVFSIKIYFHELWKDEWQSWFVAVDKNWIQLFDFLNYEGHPFLWYAYLKCIGLLRSLVGSYPEHLIQSAHFVVYIFTMFVFFFRFKMNILNKILFAFSYLLFFEYGIVNRGYVFVLLFSFYSVYLLKSDKDDSLKFAISLCLLFQTEVYGVFIAITLVLYLFLSKYRLDRKGLVQFLKTKTMVASLLGFIFFTICVYPRGNSDDFTRAYNQNIIDFNNLSESFQGLLANNFFIGFIPDTASHGYSLLGLVLSIIILTLLFYYFRKDRALWIVFAFGFLSFLSFNIFIFSGGIRQWGMFYILLICLMELRKEDNENHFFYRYTFLILITFAQITHSLKAVFQEIKLPFTNAKIAAEFIKEKVPLKVPIVSLNKFESVPVIGYANRPFYELPSGTQFTYFKWLEKVYVPTKEELKLFASYKNVGGLVLISPKQLDKNIWPYTKLWESFDLPNIKNENFYLYTFRK